MSRLLLGVATFCGCACLFTLGTVLADDHHHGERLLGNRLNKAGIHQVHNNVKGHTVHATSNGSRISSMHAMKGGNKVNPTKHVRTKNKHFTQLNTKDEIHYVMANSEEADPGVLFIGFYFNLGGTIVIFWFPSTIVDVQIINISVGF